MGEAVVDGVTQSSEEWSMGLSWYLQDVLRGVTGVFHEAWTAGPHSLVCVPNPILPDSIDLLLLLLLLRTLVPVAVVTLTLRLSLLTSASPSPVAASTSSVTTSRCRRC